MHLKLCEQLTRQPLSKLDGEIVSEMLRFKKLKMVDSVQHTECTDWNIRSFQAHTTYLNKILI
jgi:hypothetical protein